MPISDATQLTIQVVGAVATAAAAIFSAVSARAAVVAAKEMRLARRASSLPMISYSISDRTIYIYGGEPGKPNLRFSLTRLDQSDKKIEDYLQSPTLTLHNFGGPALNVQVEITLPQSGIDRPERVADFIGDPEMEIRPGPVMTLMKSDNFNTAVAARSREILFFPHIGETRPVSFKIPFSIIQQYVFLSISSTPYINKPLPKIDLHLPVFWIELNFDSSDGEKISQTHSFTYEYSHFTRNEMALIAKELESTAPKIRV